MEATAVCETKRRVLDMTLIGSLTWRAQSSRYDPNTMRGALSTPVERRADKNSSTCTSQVAL